MTNRTDGHATGMAGEFAVMERLFRLGHTPALTLGNSKMIDILVESKAGKHFRVSVESIQKGDKCPVGRHNFSEIPNTIFVFLFYGNFGDVTNSPEIYVMPSESVERLKRNWITDAQGRETYAIYRRHSVLGVDLEEFCENWKSFD